MNKNNIYYIKMFEPEHIYNIYYIKYDMYILEVDVYDVKIQYDNTQKNTIIPNFYKILHIYDIIENKEIDEIDNYYGNDFNCIENINNYERIIIKHTKKIKKGMFCIYKNICSHDNSIYKNLMIDDDNKNMEFSIFDSLEYAFTDKDMAYYEHFIDKEQWKYFTNGYTGICKKYKRYMFDPSRSYLEIEFYSINNQINGEYKKYDEYNRILEQQNYINNKKHDIGFYYDYTNDNHDFIQIEKRIYYNDNFYYSEITKNNIIKNSGYYFIDMNISYLYKFMRYIKNFRR